MDLAATSAEGTAGHSCADGKPQDRCGHTADMPKSPGHDLHFQAEIMLSHHRSWSLGRKGEAGSAPQGRLTWLPDRPQLFTNSINMPMLEIALELSSSLHTRPANHLLPQAAAVP